MSQAGLDTTQPCFTLSRISSSKTWLCPFECSPSYQRPSGRIGLTGEIHVFSKRVGVIGLHELALS